MAYTITMYSPQGFKGNAGHGLQTKAQVKAAMKALRAHAVALIVTTQAGHIAAIAVRRGAGWATEWLQTPPQSTAS